jgi:hypothetical protein
MPSKLKTTLPAFTPVPRLKDRSNGWKPEIQHAFIEALAETGSVRAAARRVGRSERGAYQMRRHPEGGPFRKAWAAALDIGIQRIEDVAMDRALNGVEVPVYSYGKLIGTRVVYNDRLLMFLLRNRAPARFAAHRPHTGARTGTGIDRAELARLKKQWRAEWQREDDESEQEVLDSIDRFIDNMRDTRRANMSPRARAAYEEADRIHEEDGTDWMLDEADADDAEVGDGGEYDPPPAPTKALPAPESHAEPHPEDPPPGPRIWTIKGELD